MPILVSMLSCPQSRSRLDAALTIERAARVPYQVLQAPGWAECSAMAECRGPHLLVFDPYGSAGLSLDEARLFHTAFPSIVLLPYGDFQRRPARDVLLLATELDVRGVVTLNADDHPTSLRLILAEVQAATVVGRVLAALEEATPPDLVPLLRLVLQRAHAPLCPDEVAHAVHRHSKTVRDHLRAAGFPPLNKLIVWARLFHAAVLMHDRGRSLESVALALQFPSPSAVHNQFVRYAGDAVRRAVQQHGLDPLVNAFVDRIRRHDWELTETKQAGAAVAA
ncbi:MAG TPA: hypothetical protein VF665_25535 [Longimicrobium sp.]|jgi:AraC-like DNA-binding protein|uniref:hypothetical protein n=1 Tax=Longimicrobium sp. TaxID=2029185 RepID=UPI002EDACB02